LAASTTIAPIFLRTFSDSTGDGRLFDELLVPPLD
jgi:hypothetical protein